MSCRNIFFFIISSTELALQCFAIMFVASCQSQAFNEGPKY